MENEDHLRAVPISAAQALSQASAADVSIYLPGVDGEAPVLYRGADRGLLDINFRRLESSGVEFLLIDPGDLARCEQALEAEIADVLANPTIEPRQKAACVQQVGVNIARDLVKVDPSRNNLGRAGVVVDSLIDGVLGDPAVGRTLLSMSAHHQSTAGHLFAVGALSTLLAYEVIGFRPDTLRSIALAGLLHDLGKISLETELLAKSTPLLPEEIDQIRQHPIESVRLLGDDPYADPTVRRMILQHHERFDGGGYPLGLGGDEIELGARIIAVTDAFHAMVGRRDYRDPIAPREAVRTMRYQVGKQFDPRVFAIWEELNRRAGHDPAGSLFVAIEPDGAASPAYHADHRSARKRTVDRRNARKPAPGNVRVHCVRTGALEGVSQRRGRVECPMHDLSRSGTSIDLPEPMYRGEIVSMRIGGADTPQWLRGIVRWCRKMPSEQWPFRAGIQFAHRISPAEAHTDQPVVGIAEGQEMLILT